MNTTRKNSSQIYDYAIIGSGLSGLCIANALGRVTSNLILLDGGDTFGGTNRSTETTIGPMNNGLRHIPATDLSQKAIAFLEMLLMTSLSPEVREIPPVTFEGGSLKSFIGFGELSPAFYEEISYFTASSHLKTSLEPHEWTQVLFNNFSGEFAPKSFVTKFNLEGDQVVSVTVNGKKTIHAKNFIYCGPLKPLATLLPEEALATKARTKLSKSSSWTAVCLDLMHSHLVTATEAIHVLNGTTQDDLGPCVGKFLPASVSNDETLQYSQWLTFVDSEEAEDSEIIGTALKKVKRQIKRAYPEGLENLKFERIVVVPDYAEENSLKLSANQTLPTCSNLWIGTGAASTHKNILGTLLQAEIVCSALGCHPLGAQVETHSESSAESLS